MMIIKYSSGQWICIQFLFFCLALHIWWVCSPHRLRGLGNETLYIFMCFFSFIWFPAMREFMMPSIRIMKGLVFNISCIWNIFLFRHFDSFAWMGVQFQTFKHKHHEHGSLDSYCMFSSSSVCFWSAEIMILMIWICNNIFDRSVTFPDAIKSNCYKFD